MKIVLLCNKKGVIQSVMIPNPKLAGQLNVEIEGGGAVHQLDVDSKTAKRSVLLGKKGEDARKDAYRRLQTLIERKPAKSKS